jgi:hypothetical protein
VVDAALIARYFGSKADLYANMTAQGVDRPQSRAEVAASALLGVSLGRSLDGSTSCDRRPATTTGSLGTGDGGSLHV